MDTPRPDWLPDDYRPDGSDTGPMPPLEPIFSRPGWCGGGHRAVYVYDMGEKDQWCGSCLVERIRRIWVTRQMNDAKDDE